MAKQQYKGSLTLEWYNKNRSIILKDETASVGKSDIPAPKINWVNKDQALFYEIDESEGKGLKPYWVDRNDIRIKETRPLVFQKAYKAIPQKKDLTGQAIEYKVVESNEDDSEIENILIRGDNLLALNTLKKMFDQKPDEEKVKCIYIDPPYNTEQAFEHYDDNLEHSQWLSMIRDRLFKLTELLRQDGIIFIQIDQKELAYLKVLCDEIFGRENFLIQINWQRTSQRTVLGQGATPVINIVEYLLVYLKNIDYKDEAIWKIEKYFESDEKVFNQYNLLMKSEGEKNLFKEIEYKGNVIRFYRHDDPILEAITSNNKNFEFYINHLPIIARRDAQQKESSLEQLILSHIEKDGSLFSVERKLKQGKNKGKIKRTFYQNDNVIYYLNTYAKAEDGKLMRKVDMNNFWLDSEISSAGIAKEGDVQFKRSKKPEALIERILSMCTIEGDIVLDSFAGSGTTLAVSQKMERKWIGIELGNHCDEFITKRLKFVISGKDQSGISKEEDINWQGSGSFKYYHLGPSIINVGQDGKGDFNWQLGRQFIEESLLSSYDYTIDNEIELPSTRLFENDSGPKVGVLRIGSKTMAAVCSLNEPDGEREMMNIDEIELLYKTLKKIYSPEFITIFTNRGVEMALDSKPEDLEIIKVPYAIFAELEK